MPKGMLDIVMEVVCLISKQSDKKLSSPTYFELLTSKFIILVVKY